MLTLRDIDTLRFFADNSGITAKKASKMLFIHGKQEGVVSSRVLMKLADGKGLRGVKEC